MDTQEGPPRQVSKWRYQMIGYSKHLYKTRLGRYSTFWLWVWYQLTEWRD